MLAIFVFVLAWLLVHHLRIKLKESELDTFLNEKNEKKEKDEDKEDKKKDEEGSDES